MHDLCDLLCCSFCLGRGTRPKCHRRSVRCLTSVPKRPGPPTHTGGPSLRLADRPRFSRPRHVRRPRGRRFRLHTVVLDERFHDAAGGPREVPNCHVVLQRITCMPVVTASSVPRAGRSRQSHGMSVKIQSSHRCVKTVEQSTVRRRRRPRRASSCRALDFILVGRSALRRSIPASNSSRKRWFPGASPQRTHKGCE